MFFWNSLAFFDDPPNVGNLISGSSAFSKTSLNIWKFTVHVKPGFAIREADDSPVKSLNDAATLDDTRL